MTGFSNRIRACPSIMIIVLLVLSMTHPTTTATTSGSSVTTSSATMTVTVTTTTTTGTITVPSSTVWPTTITTSSATKTVTVPSSTVWPTTTSASNVTSIYSNSLTINSPTFNRPNGTAGFSYYYQAIQISTAVSGRYNLRSRSSIDTYGCLYSQTFYPSSPSLNLIGCDDDSGGERQFSMNNTLSQLNVYVLVVTTYDRSDTGNYSVIATGPSTVHMSSITPSSTAYPPSTTSSAPVVSTYSNSLGFYSGTFTRPYGGSFNSYYYQAIQVVTYTTSQYNFRSTSSIDTYGCYYNDYFDPTYPYSNLLGCDDDSGGDQQFSINVTLYYSQMGVFVVTTYSPETVGGYSVLATGPAAVQMSSLTPTTMISSTITSSTPATSTYSDYLDYSSGTFVRPYGNTGENYYYEAIQVYTYTSGTYTFQSSGSLNAYGCLYSGYFNPSSVYSSLITCSYSTAGSGAFTFTASLPYATSYILVVTTYYSSTIGDFTVQTTGPGTVYMYKTTPSSTTTSSSGITSTFPGTLDDTSDTFARPNGDGSSHYYYEAIQLTISTISYYSLTSISLIDTYGCLYSSSFDPSNPTYNLIICDDDSAGSRQFLINQYLNSYTTYILVVTTFSALTLGSFTVQATGPASVGMTSISPSNSSGTWNVLEIVALAVACSIVFLIIVVVCACRRKRRTLERQRLLSSNRNVNVQPVTNASQFTGQGSLFSVIPRTSPPVLVEEPPPSYDTFMAQTASSEQIQV